jgi:thioredoxin reductase
LKSEGFASNLDTPDEGGTLADYCQARGLPYADQGAPVPLELFNAYASWFQTRFVPGLEEHQVVAVAKSENGFRLTLDNGERFEARHVVNAVGIGSFAHVAPKLARLPDWAASHSYDHRNVDQFKGREIVVVGAGASAIDLAAQLKDCGADVRVLAQEEEIRFSDAPEPMDGSVLKQLRQLSSGIGPGLRSFLCVHAPLLFHRLPERLRLRTVKSHLGPAPGWFMRARIEGRVTTLLGREILHAQTEGDRVAMRILDQNHAQETITCDHVISATGYRPALGKLEFLDTELLQEIAQVDETPILSDQFESSVPGLYFTGPVAAGSFGPLMRFMVGAEFAAPRMAAHLARELKAGQRRAA